jgi:predicted enzyme related to lactoylglutathione lyase
MTNRMLRATLPWLLLALGGLTTYTLDQDEMTAEPAGTQVHFLEFVTSDFEATCANLAQVHGVTFGDPVPEFGGARTAELANGGMISVRAPMRDTEDPVTRAYLLVEDIEAAAKAAAEAGCEIAMPPMELPGHGKFAIYLHGGIQHGLWEI